MMHMLSRARFFGPGSLVGQRRIARFLSPDSSPQGGYDYYCCIEELMVRQLPFTANAPFNTFGGFDWERRSLPVMTFARGTANAATKVGRIAHMVVLENTKEGLGKYRAEVKNYLSDQASSEKTVARRPFGDQGEVDAVLKVIQETTLIRLCSQGCSDNIFVECL